MKQKVDYDMLPGTGIITLYDKADRIIRCIKYTSKGHKKEMIETWRKEYGIRFNECCIHIMPGVKELNVDKFGRNTRTEPKSDWHDGVKTIGIKNKSHGHLGKLHEERY